jgi:hypothetical protein
MILILVFKQREKEAGNRRWIKNKMRSVQWENIWRQKLRGCARIRWMQQINKSMEANILLTAGPRPIGDAIGLGLHGPVVRLFGRQLTNFGNCDWRDGCLWNTVTAIH